MFELLFKVELTWLDEEVFMFAELFVLFIELSILPLLAGWFKDVESPGMVWVFWLEEGFGFVELFVLLFDGTESLRIELFTLPALSIAFGGTLLLLSAGTWATKAQQLIVHSRNTISVFIKINFLGYGC